MDALAMQALLERHNGAMKVVESLDTDERWGLLGMVIEPTPDVLEASMEKARANGVTILATAMAKRRAKTVKKRPRPKPSKKRYRATYWAAR